LFNFGIVAGSLTSNSFVKNLTSVSAARGIFTHGGMDTSCAECCGKPASWRLLKLWLGEWEVSMIKLHWNNYQREEREHK
jgi:hypothetical protein